MAKKKTIRTIPQERTPMPEQDPAERARNFKEVAIGYTLEMALREADRCLQCPDEPCMRGCPVSIDIPAFIQKIAEKHYRGAYDVITDTNLLPSVCGRVCPQESQCEGVCTVGDTLEPVAIGRLERFVGDMAIREGWVNRPHIEPSGFRVGIVGSGPAGMACAADMAKAGCEVVVYEAFHEPGGVLKYGIPDFRLPNAVIDVEIDKLRELGVRFECNTLVGRLFTIEQMVDRDGLPRGVPRHRRRLPELHGHSGRIAERRAVGERAPHALQPDARPRLSEFRHAADARQTRRRDRRGQHRDGCASRVAAPGRREGATACTAAARPRRRRASRRFITPARRASSFTG